MQLRSVPTGSRIRCDVRGTTFPACVTGSPADGWLPVEPLVPNVSYRRVRSRQIQEVLARPTRSGQLSLGGSRGEPSDPFRTRLAAAEGGL